MTKNLNNSMRPGPKAGKPSVVSMIAPAIFPLVVVVLGYLIGKQFFGI